MQSWRSGKNILKRTVGNSLISLALIFATVPHAYAAPQAQTRGTFEERKKHAELSTLIKLSDEGLLEAYILIGRAEVGIAKDYEIYRDSHREKIAQYISEWMIQPAP